MTPPLNHQGAATGPPGGRQVAATGSSSNHGIAATGPSVDHGVAIAAPQGNRQVTATGPSGDHQGAAAEPPEFDLGFLADVDLDVGLIGNHHNPEIAELFDELGKVINCFRRLSDGNIVTKAVELASHITAAERTAAALQPGTAANIEPVIFALGTARQIRKNSVKRELRKLEACRKGTDLIARLRAELGGL